MFGPTLLDMRDIYMTDLSIITVVIIPKAIGSMVGASVAGILLDKFQKHRYFILFGFTAALSLSTMVLPHLSYLWLFFVASVMSSFSAGALDTGGNVLCLDVWSAEKGEAGPYMHSIHFSFAIGAFLAPLIAIPFLGNQSQEQDGIFSALTNANSTIVEDQGTQITVLYPVLGILGIVCSLCYLAFGFFVQGARMKNSTREMVQVEENPQHTFATKLLLATMALFFFFYVGAEVTYGVYVAVFVVECRLKLTKKIGAQITAIFWGFFALMRFLSIFAAIYLQPSIIMVFSCAASIIASIGLAIFAETYPAVLWIGSGILGFGMASIYATGLLWLESHMKITNRVGAVLTVAGSVGADVFPIILGQFVETIPMILMYITCGTVSLSSCIFILAIVLGKKVQAVKDAEVKIQEEEKNAML